MPPSGEQVASMAPVSTMGHLWHGGRGWEIGGGVRTGGREEGRERVGMSVCLSVLQSLVTDETIEIF